MEGEGNDKGGKHDEAADAEDKEETGKIHADKERGAGQENCEHRKSPLRMNRSGNVAQFDGVLFELLQEMRQGVRREDGQSDGAGREKNDEKRHGSAGAGGALQGESQQGNQDNGVDDARGKSDSEKKRRGNGGVERTGKRLSEESDRDGEVEEVSEVVAAGGEVAEISGCA